MSSETKKSFSETTRWGIGLLFAFTIEFVGVVWYASAYVTKVDNLQIQVERNTASLQDLKTNSPVIITREQLNDILQVRDTRLDTIDARMIRIENKLDQAIK